MGTFVLILRYQAKQTLVDVSYLVRRRGCVDQVGANAHQVGKQGGGGVHRRRIVENRLPNGPAAIQAVACQLAPGLRELLGPRTPRRASQRSGRDDNSSSSDEFLGRDNRTTSS
jgi:hypothetical protein